MRRPEYSSKSSADWRPDLQPIGDFRSDGVDAHIKGFRKGWPLLNMVIGDHSEGAPLAHHRGIIIHRTIAEVKDQPGSNVSAMDNLDHIADGDTFPVTRLQ
jgi:hypothetical protein